MRNLKSPTEGSCPNEGPESGTAWWYYGDGSLDSFRIGSLIVCVCVFF